MRIRGNLPLFIRVNAKLARLGAELEGSGRHLEKLRSLQSDGDMREVISREAGYALHNMYNGIEQILEDIARDVDGGQPGGLNSHSDLLDQLHFSTDIRPAVVTDMIFEDLQDLMKFRHVFRHGYGMTLRAQEVDAKYQALVSKVLPEFLRSLQELSDHLSAEDEPDRDGLEDGPP